MVSPPVPAGTGIPTAPGMPPLTDDSGDGAAGAAAFGVLPPGPSSVALLLPLTGPSGELGTAMFDAAQMALFDVGAEQLVLLPMDTAGTPEGAARAAEMAIADGVALILGPLFSGSVAGITPLAQEVGVNVIAFSSDREVARPGVFIMGFLPGQQVERITAYAVERGYRRFAALAPESDYGYSVARELRRVSEALVTDLVDVVFYPADAKSAADVDQVVRVFTNYDARHQRLLAQREQLIGRDDEVSREALRRLEELDTVGELHFDAVLLPEGGTRLLTVAPLLPYYDVDPATVRLLGTAQWESARTEEEPAMFGGWFAAPAPEARARFEQRFETIYGRPPPRLATLAYDAVALVGALSQMPDGRGYTAEVLTSAGGFRGVDGLFRFAPDGTNERGLAVLEVTPEGLVTISEAPNSFESF